MGEKAKKGQAGKKPSQGGAMSAGKIGIIIVALLAVVAIAVGMSEIDTEGSKAPAGSDCAANVEYLQAGVDSYKQAFGELPTTFEQLLETKDGKGPFVERIDYRCPSTGRPYKIQNGIVTD
jgi:hypothetical protein